MLARRRDRPLPPLPAPRPHPEIPAEAVMTWQQTPEPRAASLAATAGPAGCGPAGAARWLAPAAAPLPSFPFAPLPLFVLVGPPRAGGRWWPWGGIRGTAGGGWPGGAGRRR